MLKSEFGFFRKDSSVQQRPVDNKKEVDFIYYETDLDEEEKPTEEKKKKNKDRSNTFWGKLKEEEKKKDSGVEYEDDGGN